MDMKNVSKVLVNRELVFLNTIFHDSKFYNLSGDIIDTTPWTQTGDYYAYIEKSFEPGEYNYFRIRCANSQQTTIPQQYRRAGYVFFDNIGNIIEMQSSSDEIYYKGIIHAPNNACKIIVNGETVPSTNIYYGPLVEFVSQNDNRLDIIANNISIVYDLMLYNMENEVIDMSQFVENSGEYYSYIEKTFEPGENNYFRIRCTNKQTDVASQYRRFGYIFFNRIGTVVQSQPSTDETYFDGIVHAPNDATKLIVNGYVSNTLNHSPIAEYVSQQKTFNNSNSRWYGKKIVWFGTSIPEGSVNGKSYPKIIEERFGATIYNESLGASPMSNHSNNAGNYLALSLTYAEKQQQSWWNNLTDSQKTSARNSSYDYKVTKYLSNGSVGPCDLYVFDHGYNDFDDNHIEKFLQEPQNPNDKTYPLGAVNFLINSILNDNPRARIVWIGHYENKLDDITYHQSRGKYVAQLQEYISDKYGIPLCRTWEKTGWSNPHKITTTGYWNNNIWVPNGGTSRQDYVKDCMFSDGIHPHFDGSGYSIKLLANIIGDYLETL